MLSRVQADDQEKTSWVESQKKPWQNSNTKRSDAVAQNTKCFSGLIEQNSGSLKMKETVKCGLKTQHVMTLSMPAV